MPLPTPEQRVLLNEAMVEVMGVYNTIRVFVRHHEYELDRHALAEFKELLDEQYQQIGAWRQFIAQQGRIGPQSVREPDTDVAKVLQDWALFQVAHNAYVDQLRDHVQVIQARSASPGGV